jgi:hypothetical protein
MNQIRITDKEIRHGKYRWTISGVVHNGGVRLDRIEGPIHDLEALRAGVYELITATPRYQQMIDGAR